MGGVGMRAVAYLLASAGFVCVVTAVGLIAGGLWALLVAGVLLLMGGLLLVQVPEQPERVSAPGVAPLGSAAVPPAGR